MSNFHHRSRNAFLGIYLFFQIALLFSGCAHFTSPTIKNHEHKPKGPKVFIFILDALKRRTLFESLDTLPHFKAAIKGENQSYPYIYFENVLVSIPSGSKPVNTTLLTGVYPWRHGIPSTIWFDREKENIKTLTSITQRRIIDILEKTGTDTIFDYVRRSGKSALAVGTQITKGVESRDWIKQSMHLWGQAFWVNLLFDGNANPDGAYLDKKTTKGIIRGHLYSFSDGLKGWLKATGDIPDLVVVHYMGLDIFTHFPRRFMVKENWGIDRIQKWYLKEVLDPEIGKIMTILKDNNVYEDTIFLFVADHGQTRIKEYIDEERFAKLFTECYHVMDKPFSVKESDMVILPGAGTKTIYIKNRTRSKWYPPPRLLEDVKPAVDILIDDDEVNRHLNGLLIAQYPGERDAGIEESDSYWFFNINRYRGSGRHDKNFINALEPLSRLDEWAGRDLEAAFMYRRDFDRISIPDIIFINKPGHYFTPNQDKYAHHGSFYADDAYVSFIFSGPAIHLFLTDSRVISQQIHSVDLLPMAAYLLGVCVNKPVDGENALFFEVK